MKVSAKQDSIADAVAAGKKEILLEGALGTSKTYGAALVLLGIAVDFPGSRIFVGRRHLTEMRTSTIPSFEEAANDMGLVAEKHYRLTSGSLPTLKVFGTETTPPSYVFFIGIDHIKDPQFIKIKGLNMTCGLIDEADGVTELGFTTFHSRTGRANKNGAPDFTLVACNANDGWIKRRYYNKHHHPEAYGQLDNDQCVIEFDLEDSFLGQEYYRKFWKNPPQWVERYLKNNWDYGDDVTSLFKYRYLDSLHTDNFSRTGNKTIGYDVARQGSDRSVCGLWVNDVLVDLVIVKDFDEVMDGGEQARWLHQYATEHQVGYENIIVDGVGNGVTVIDNLKTLYGWEVKAFIAGAVPEVKKAYERRKKQFPDTPKPALTYNNLRSEQTYLLAQATEKGEVKFYDGCPYLADFKKEATMHNYDTTDKVMVIEPKDKVKQRTGHSPDVFDCVMMGYYGHTTGRQTVGSYSNRQPAKDRRSSGSTIPRLSTKGRTITRGLRGKQF